MRAAARAAKPLKGHGVRLHRDAAEGVTVHAEAHDNPRHPWQLSCRWRHDPKLLPARGEWVAAIEPGFVNGRDVTIRVRTDEGDVHPALTDEPAPEITFGAYRDPAAPAGLAAGNGGQIEQQAGEGYPAFFDTMGVRPSAKAGAVGAELEPERKRLIRAADVVLITPRLSTRQEVTVQNPATASQSVTISTVFVTDALRGAPSPHRIVTTAKHVPPREPDQLERLLGAYAEPQADEIKLATVYFVSPPDAPENAVPDATWSVHPRYFVFRNLNYATEAQIPDQPSEPITLRTGLIAGGADAIFAQLLATPNDTLNRLTAFLRGSRFGGMYWTPGMLGMSGVKRPTRAEPAQGSAGLDPAARRRQREAARARKQLDETPPLNPPFPFLKLAFDPWFFGIEADPKQPPA